jgi:hypothetical protein
VNIVAGRTLGTTLADKAQRFPERPFLTFEDADGQVQVVRLAWPSAGRAASWSRVRRRTFKRCGGGPGTGAAPDRMTSR